MINFPTSGLTGNCKAWHHFIIAKLVPSSNISEVTKGRALLNYAIQKGYSFDVGIQNSILSILAGSVTSSLGDSSLIHDLCIQRGVTMRESNEVLHPKPPLTREL